MKQLVLIITLLTAMTASAQDSLFMPRNIKRAYENGFRSIDGKPGKNYWQNTGHYDIHISVAPPDKTIHGFETITYFNQSPNPVKNIVIKLILNIHQPGAERQSRVKTEYLTSGIHIDRYLENGKETPLRNPGASTWTSVPLNKELGAGDSVRLSISWHYDLSEQSGREGKLDSTSFFLAYFYPRVAVMDDVDGWDEMAFTDLQEFYNDFNDYRVSLTVPKNFLVWGTGELMNASQVLQPAFVQKLKKSFLTDSVMHLVTAKELQNKSVTNQNDSNTWIWEANHITDVAFCVSDSYVWDAASAIVDTLSGRRASCQSAYDPESKNFEQQVKNIQYSLRWYSNNWPGIAYPFRKSTIIMGSADMEYPMMANDHPDDDASLQRQIAEHEIAHSYFPFYMGINEHRYGFMDEGWTTAFENMIGGADMGKEKEDYFFKQFRVSDWALDPTDETQIPIITPGNLLSVDALGQNEYGKPALAYLGLKDLLGDVVFKKSLQGFMERWHGKHPIPWDMFYSFSDLSGKNLNWYFKNWFFTPYYMDIAMGEVEPDANGYQVRVKNTGGFAIPFDLLAEYADGTKDRIHQTPGVWEKDQKLALVSISTKKKLVSLKLDTGIFEDADDSNNYFHLSSSTLIK